jgi:hypothetical protein
VRETPVSAARNARAIPSGDQYVEVFPLIKCLVVGVLIYISGRWG